MAREKYNHEKESQIIGMYPPQKGAIWFSPNGLPESPRYYRPITPCENYKMMFRGETPYWIPDCGPFTTDLQCFRPRQHPDNLANHQPFDGGDSVDFEALGNIIPGWFDIPYQFEESCGGSSPQPGIIKIPDIEEWEKYITFPNLDDMDWDEIVEMNKEFLGTDKANQLGLQFSYWERLMNAMGVADAAVALIDEDQKEGVHRFFDKLTDLYIDYVTRMTKCCRLDGIVVHDDWGHSTGAFFSLDTCMEMIVPHFKRFIAACHNLGLVFEHHSCGKTYTLVPAMIEAGVDYWMPQPALNNLDMLVEQYKDAPITFAVSSPILAPTLTEEEIDALAKEWVEKYQDANVLVAPNMIFSPENDMGKYPSFKNAVYKYSRIAYQDL